MIPAPSKGDIEVAELRQARGQEPARPQPEKVEPSFDDLVDTLNPLQHIPGVASIYREVTGDEISGHAQVAGSTLYGGPIGMLAGAMQAAMTEESGKNMVDTIAASFAGDESGAGTGQAQQRVAEQATDATSTAGANTDGAGERSTSGASPGGQSQTAATAALPEAFNAVLPPAAEAAEARSNVAQNAASGGSDSSKSANPESNVLEGKKALAAFARDKAAVAKDAADANALAANGAAKTDNAADGRQAEANRTASAQQTAANHDFMKLRESDYNTSAQMRARSDRLQELQAEAANSVTPRVDANNNVDDADDDGDRSAAASNGMDPAGVPDDFASRMKEALSKYRSMHKTDE